MSGCNSLAVFCDPHGDHRTLPKSYIHSLKVSNVLNISLLVHLMPISSAAKRLQKLLMAKRLK